MSLRQLYFTAVGLLMAVAMVGCSGNKSNAQGQQVPKTPPVIQADTSAVRGTVQYTLTLSNPMEIQLRNANKNPSNIRAQLVQYTDTSKNQTWEVLELSNAGQGDTSASATPFYTLQALMSTYIGGETRYHIVADISTQFTSTTYPEQTIGQFKLSDQLLDLCSVDYEDVCHFDNDSTVQSFTIFAWLQ